jgi:hypothetical protein
MLIWDKRQSQTQLLFVVDVFKIDMQGLLWPIDILIIYKAEFMAQHGMKT